MIAFRAATCAAFAALALALGACGGDDGPPEVLFTFGGGELTPVTVTRPAGETFELVIRDTDARPHSLTITGPTSRTRVLVPPENTYSLVIEDPPAGRYRLVPDGATEPATLIVK